MRGAGPTAAANRPPPNGGVEVELVVPFRPDVQRRVS